jgi:hypothetical protein
VCRDIACHLADILLTEAELWCWNFRGRGAYLRTRHKKISAKAPPFALSCTLGGPKRRNGAQVQRLPAALNKRSVVLVVGVVAVAVNLFLYFGYWLPRTTPLIERIPSISKSIPEAIPEVISKSLPEASPESPSGSPPKSPSDSPPGEEPPQQQQSPPQNSPPESPSDSPPESPSGSPPESPSDSPPGEEPPQQQQAPTPQQQQYL